MAVLSEALKKYPVFAEIVREFEVELDITFFYNIYDLK